MNQILSMDDNFNNNGGFNSGGFNGGDKPKKTLDTNTTVLIFAICMIVFGVAILGTSIFSLVTSLTKEEVIEVTWPRFSTYQNENTLEVTVAHNKVIDKVMYAWNNGFETAISGNSTENMNFQLEVPIGNNVLKLVVVDTEGNTNEYVKAFTGVELMDTTKPVIELSIVGSKLNIVGKTTTETLLSYMTYRWNDEAETRVDATNDRTMIETQIPVIQGVNTLTITVVNENGVSITDTRKFNGSVKPSINVEQYGSNLTIQLSHDSGIKSATVVFNNKNISLTADRFGEDKKVVEFTLNLKDGQNTIYIEAISMDGTSDTYNGIANV